MLASTGQFLEKLIRSPRRSRARVEDKACCAIVDRTRFRAGGHSRTMCGNVVLNQTEAVAKRTPPKSIDLLQGLFAASWLEVRLRVELHVSRHG